MIKARLVNLGTRVPADLKKSVSEYCDRNGVKLQFFVMEAIKEKFNDLQQDAFDNGVVDERLKNPEFSSVQDLKNYMEHRKKNA